MGNTVLVDTNFLLIPGRKHRDVIGELQKEGYAIFTLRSVVKELESLSQGTSNTAGEARLALSLIKQKGLKVVPSSVEYADEAILAYCRTHKCSVATQDLALRRALRSAGIPIVSLNRSGKLTGGN